MPTLTTPTYTDLGNTGPSGPQGPQGIKGKTGDTGPRGVAGPSGPLGPTGQTPIFDVSSNTGAAGTYAIVTQTGTAENVDLHFTIPKGDKGNTGTIEASYYLTPGEPVFTLDPTNGNTFINGTLDVSGNSINAKNVTINGTLRAGTLEVGSSKIAISDPVLQVGSNDIDDNLNRGISFKYFEDSSKVGFFGYDQSDNTFVFKPVASDAVTTGIFTGDYGTAKFGKVVVGNSSIGVIESNGNQNLVLQTGNTSTGTITITDGASGNISLTPNGTGSVVISKADINSGTIDGTTIATSNITVGNTKTLDVSYGTLTTSSAQNKTIMEGAGSNVDIGNFDLRAQTLTADSLTSGRVIIAGTNGLLSQDPDLTFSGDTLTATNISGTLQTASQTNITSVGALSGGSITSGFGSINNGSSSITTTGTISGGSLTDGTATLSSGNLSAVGTIGSGAITSTGLITGGSASFGTTAATVSTSGVVTISNTTGSTSKDTGALIVEGGVGIEEHLYVGGTIYGTISGGGSGSVGAANNLSGGAINQIPYQTGPNTTVFSSGLTYNPSSTTLTAGTFSGALTGNVTGNVDGIVGGSTPAAGTFSTVTINGATPIVLNGATPNDFETSIAVTDPTADRTITLPDATGTVCVSGGTGLTLSAAGDMSVDASQTQITAVGTITGGTWNGTAIANAYVADDLTISGGTVNNTVIGGATPAAGTFTDVTATTLTVGGSSLSFTTVTVSPNLTLGNTIINATGLTATLPLPTTAGELITIYSPSYSYILDSGGGGATPTISANTVTVCIATGASAGDWVAYASGVFKSFA